MTSKSVPSEDERRAEVNTSDTCARVEREPPQGGQVSKRTVEPKDIGNTTATIPSTPARENDNAEEYDPAGLEPPEGGLVAWAQVASAHLISAMTWGYAASFGVYQLHYTDTLGLPSAQVSWIGSIQVFLSLAVCTPSGRLADAGYARATVIVGCALAVLGILMTSFATAYWQLFLAQGICTGLGLGLAFMPTVSVVSSYFSRNRPIALSIAAVGTSIGSIVFPATIHYLKARIGFPWAVRCATLIAFIFCAVACLLLKPRLPPRKAGPWVEWSAFRELPYLLFTLGAFLNFYVLFVGFFYVSLIMASPTPHHCPGVN